MQSRERFLKAASLKPVDRPPVWLMRQAGRHLPEYRQLRREHSLLEMFLDKDLIVEASLQPWRRYGLDGVILFSDILIPAIGMGMDLDFVEGVGPKFKEPLKNRDDVERLTALNPKKDIPFLDALKILRGTIKEEAALIGFCGSAWTTAVYMVRNSGSNKIDALHQWKNEKPELLHQLLSKVTDSLELYLAAQVDAGVDLIQIFDTWGGMLSLEEYEEWSLPYINRLIESVQSKGAPLTLFVKNSSHLISLLAKSKANILSIGVDLPMSEAKKIVGSGKGLQGNFDSEMLASAKPKEIRCAAKVILESMKNQPGFIFNLGHGVLPQTPVDNVSALVEAVQNF